MTSSTMAGERRWGSARRGGMTVLGKVAVPKPLNLPSQRLENHGLDPSVEIVPKGTLNWGSRSSSSATNAWGSSSLSPSADGSANSPSHLSGRPSSGGSGTRPSTGGSDRQIEPTGNAWGPNSRPSSASGALASNQSSLTSLRPRSAETRPGSSHLSRFAEPSSDTPGAWGASGTTERLGVVSSKKDEFYLSTGDFPTLGADKDHPGKSTEFKDPGSQSRPSSASGRVLPSKDKAETSHADDASGAVNLWRKDGYQNAKDGVQPSLEKLHGDPQQHFNPNVPPQQFDAWRGPPVNAPAGNWYRGPPGGPPYGAPVGPGGFPIEPFPYFHPHFPPPAFANSQPIPPPRAGPRGHHPRSGNAYRPQIPDPYVRPGMPFRPGFYPPMAFEGYYGPPTGYCNSNERDIPFMGMGAGPSVYDRCLPPNAPNPGDSHARAGGAAHGKAMSDDVESVHSGDARGPYKVLMKNHDDWGREENIETRARMPSARASSPAKGQKAVVVPRKYEWGAEDDGEEDIYASHDVDNRSGYSDTVQAKYSQSFGSMKPVDHCRIKNSETVTLSSSQTPQVSSTCERDSAFPSTLKGATLMQKIEVLNAKVRASDGRVHNASSGEMKMSVPNTVSTKADTFTNKAGKSDVVLERTSPSGYFPPTSQGIVVSAGDKIARPPATILRRPSHGTSSENNHHGKGKFSKHDADGWQRNSMSAESPSVVSASTVESARNLEENDAHPPMEAAMVNPLAKGQGDSAPELHDSTDSQEQRAKKRELAKQRALQLQKEEEERTREQKAKALAKLEELNRRTLSGDASNQTNKKPLASGTSKKEQEGSDMETRDSAAKLETSKLEELNCGMQSGDASKKATEKPLASGTSKKVQEGKDRETRESASKLEASKLEELNRHMQSGDASKQAIKTPSAGTSKKVQEGRDRELKESASKLEASAFVSPLKTEVVSLNKENSGIQVAGSDILSQALPRETSITLTVGSISCDVSVPLKQNAVNAHVADGKYSEQLVEGGGSKFKRTSYKKKQNTVMLKNLNEKSNPVDATSEVSLNSQPYLPNNSSTVFELSAPQRRRSNKSTKNKNKQADAPSIPASTSDTFHEAIPPKDSDKDVICQLPSLGLNTGPIQAVVNGESAVELSEQRSSFTSEEAHGKVNQWKPQRSRRMPRNQPASRFVDKFHGNEPVIWAPVRSQNKAENKTEATVEGDQKPIADSVSPANCENPVHNSLKSKRAEMERYVPKPVAKELAQQVGMQKPESSVAHKSTPGETASQQPISSVTGNTGSPLQSMEGVAKHNKQGKSHGAWRQRGSTEFSDAKNLQQGSSFTSNASKNPQEAIRRNHPSNPEANSAQPKAKTSRKLNASDSWVESSNSDAFAPDASPFLKNEGVAGKGNRHTYRGHRNMGNSYNNANKHISSAETDKTQIQSPFSDINQSDRGIASKEGVSSHWEPKSHVNSVSSLKGSRATGCENVNAEASRVTKEDYPRQQRVNTPPQHDEKTNYIDKNPFDQLVSDNKVGADVQKARNYELSRERKMTSSKGRPYSPNQNFAANESGPANSSNTQQERPFSAGSRRHGNQFRPSGRGHEYRGDFSGQDSRQHNRPTNRDRQRHNMHYEYQPVGSYTNHDTRSKNSEGLADGTRNAGPRFKDRSPNNLKRGGGNFNGQLSASVPVDAGWE